MFWQRLPVQLIQKGPRQPHLGAQHLRCRCSLPGLTGFTVRRRERTGADPLLEYALAMP